MFQFTTEDLLLYLYNELPILQKEALEDALQRNWALREKLQVLKEASERINRLKKASPRQQTIEQIMQYAASVTVTNAE